MTYLCRFNQRNRLIEVPSTSEYYNQQNGISHEHLKQLISRHFDHRFFLFLFSFFDLVQEFQIPKSTLIIQIWNEQYQEYIDIESYKKIPSDGRLQVLMYVSLISFSKNSTLLPPSLYVR